MAPKKLIAISDIHGRYNALREVVDERLLSKEYRYVFLGDYLGYGEQSSEVLQYLWELKKKFPKQVFLLYGNWEALIFQAVFSSPKNQESARKKIAERRFEGGLNDLLKDGKALEIIRDFPNTLDMGYYDGAFCFTHAGVDPSLVAKKWMPLREIIYGSSILHLLWNFDFSQQMKGIKTPFTFVVGHRAVQSLSKSSKEHPVPFVEGKVITIDFGAENKDGYLGYLRFDEGQVSFAKTKVK